MKKLLSGIIVAVAIFGLSAQGAFAFFSDMTTEHWAYKQIKDLSEQSIVIGYPDGTFKPDENVTRAEFASMAIKALGQEHANVIQPIQFSDIDETYWAHDAIEKAVYFDLISNDKDSDTFRPEDPVSRAEAINIAVNSLTTEQISAQKAHDVLEKKYKDVNDVPDWFIVAAGKAEILEMFAAIPEREHYIDADRPATRAEVTAILNNMMIQAKLNPNAKLAEAMRKKTGEGYVIPNAYVQGTVGTIPQGTVVPIKVNKGFSSQTSQKGEEFTAETDQNYITRDKYILIYKGTQFKGVLQNVQPGKWFIRNGVLTLGTNIINTPNDQNFMLETTGDVTMKKNKFMCWVRKVFKGEKLTFPQGGTLYVKFLKEIKTDLTNGWIYCD
ncbi:MAG: S-layer homology domain-containing protein [Candidatus Gastranaerophilales bacterium]|nr:S-layer homology domain-containing protein [Candidatus Gastranaerophilales bacterium]